MAIGARVVGVPFVAALVTSFQMTAERRGATQFDRAQHPPLLRGHRSSMRLEKLVAVGTHDIGDFQGRWRRDSWPEVVIQIWGCVWSHSFQHLRVFAYLT